MKKTFYGGLLLFILLYSLPLNTRAADVASPDVAVLTQQLTAIERYLARTYGSTAATPLTSEEFRTSIEAGAEWLKNAQESSGHFRYEYAPYAGTYASDDNIVRQAGALYALGEITRRDTRDSLALAHTIERAISYFESISKEDVVGGEAISCIANSDTSTKCALGATSLALIGILDYVQENPKEKAAYADHIRAYAEFIRAAQKENGGFRNTHHVGREKQSDAESPFSNGEALLALVRYYQYAPDPEVKAAIDDAFVYLAEKPYDTALYLWIMAAQKDMYALWPSNTYVTYTKSFTDWRVADAVHRAPGKNYCAYAEGLASALSVLKENVPQSEYALLRNELNRTHRANYTLQVTQEDVIRLLPTTNGLSLETLESGQRAFGGFLTSDAEPKQRIDYTQHCITGYVQTLVDIDAKPL